MSKSPTAQLNQLAPDFALPAISDKQVRLSDFRGKQCVVVFFYPKDDTSGCTAESCAFRDRYELFKEKGAAVIGISSDSLSAHEKFISRYKLPFILLSDAGGKVRSAWGVPTTLGIFPGRVSYVIDKKGIIRGIYDSQLDPLGHVDKALKVLSQINWQ